MRDKNSKRLVIDADVAQGAGGKNATHPRSKHCRDFLNTVLSLRHRVVMTEKISNEWKGHQSRFARRWRVSMDARKKVDRIDSLEDNTLRDKIVTTTSDADEIAVMQKDFHLLEAALVTDQTIISLDQTVRELFAQASKRVGEIRHLIWVNLDQTEKADSIAWLQNGAPPEEHRRLSA